MIFLLLSILTSALLYGIFKVFKIKEVNTLQAITFNYLVCAAIGIFSSDSFAIGSWIVYALILGAMFITLFNMIAATAQEFGMAVASIADRLGLIIPVIAAFLLYKEDVTILKVLGVILAIAAVFLAVAKEKGAEKSKRIWLPIVVFVGGGTLATLIKHVQFNYPELDFNFFLTILFLTAGCLGVILVSGRQLMKKEASWSLKSVIAGIGLGIPNYGSMYFILKTLDLPSWDSSVVFPVNNIGVVVLSAIIGYLAFGERFSKKNIIGIALAVVAIGILMAEQLGWISI